MGGSVTKTDGHLRQVYNADVHRPEPGQVTAMKKALLNSEAGRPASC